VDLLADDTVAIEEGPGGLVVQPTERTYWLREDAARALGALPEPRLKVAVDAPRCAPGPVPLAAIVKLSFDETCPSPHLRPVRGREAFRLLSESMFRFVIDEKPAAVRDFDLLSAIGRGVDILELIRRPSLDDLAACDEAIHALCLARSNRGRP
jgi:hypothetical protein